MDGLQVDGLQAPPAEPGTELTGDATADERVVAPAVSREQGRPGAATGDAVR